MEQANEIIKEEKKILAEEKAVLAEIKKEEQMLFGIKRSLFMLTVLLTLGITALSAGLVYWSLSSARVYIDKSSILAPQVDLSSPLPGVLGEVYVHVGDQIAANTMVARVGNNVLFSKTAGLVIAVQSDIGKLFNPSQPIVSMIDPTELRVVGQVEEDKGLKDISVGQSVVFTVDTFGSKKYYGVVDEVSPTSRNSDVVFNISDKREVKQFDVKARFNVAEYPELKNGMSAKMWVYKQ